jgi:lipopolysaccharide/colanic/teichoic acid biosynthesis glycosyltransferase
VAVRPFKNKSTSGAPRTVSADTKSTANISPASTDGTSAFGLLQKTSKRSFDIIAATIALILLSPIFLLSSLAIVLGSGGSIVDSRVRRNYHNERFRVLKFRSTAMEIINDDIPVKSKALGVTRVGRILRSTGIEELPQLINVLRGEMSIVGPHPYTTLPTEIFNEQIAQIVQRSNITPGLTGWAQVNGCWEQLGTFKVMQRRIEYDLYYVENWSFLFDMKIILMTLCSKKTYAIAPSTSDR